MGRRRTPLAWAPQQGEPRPLPLRACPVPLPSAEGAPQVGTKANAQGAAHRGWEQRRADRLRRRRRRGRRISAVTPWTVHPGPAASHSRMDPSGPGGGKALPDVGGRPRPHTADAPPTQASTRGAARRYPSLTVAASAASSSPGQGATRACAGPGRSGRNEGRCGRRGPSWISAEAGGSNPAPEPAPGVASWQSRPRRSTRARRRYGAPGWRGPAPSSHCRCASQRSATAARRGATRR